MCSYFFLLFCVFFAYTSFSTAYFSKPPVANTTDLCFCQLKGKVDDCGCNVDTVDYFNNVKIYPRLKSILQNPYFRYYKVNLNQECPYWSEDSRCAIRSCHVEACSPQDIPPGIKGYNENRHDMDAVYLKYAEESNCNHDVDNELGYLNTSISDASYKSFEQWQAHDLVKDNFCEVGDETEGAEYVDLMLNPERYTGYKGESAHRVWQTIYLENCFLPPKSYGTFIQSSKLNDLCLEKRAFYRVVSGLHSSINIHLSAKYLLQEQGVTNPNGVWGPNVAEFHRRFSPETTGGEGPQWLRNLYFLYLLELRAISKASRFLERTDFYTGHSQEDEDLRSAVHDLLRVVRDFPDHFDESNMFAKGTEGSRLKREFQEHFRNISRIMNCVGCDKCKLWGKLQIHGVGTALKILFSGRFDESNPTVVPLKRGEAVALFNSFGRLSTSIHELENFRAVVR